MTSSAWKCVYANDNKGQTGKEPVEYHSDSMADLHIPHTMVNTFAGLSPTDQFYQWRLRDLCWLLWPPRVQLPIILSIKVNRRLGFFFLKLIPIHLPKHLRLHHCSYSHCRRLRGRCFLRDTRHNIALLQLCK